MLLPSAITCDASSSSQSSHQRPALQQSLFASPPTSPPPTVFLNSSAGSFSNIINTCRSLQSLLAGPAPPAMDFSSATAFNDPLADGHNSSAASLNGLGITTQESSHEPPSSTKQLPTPPLTYAPSPLKLRLRPRRAAAAASASAAEGSDAGASNNSSNSIQRRRIAKRVARGANSNKRRRVVSDEEEASSANDDVESDLEISGPILGTPFSGFPSTSASSTGDQRVIPGEEAASSAADEPMAPHTPKRARIAPEVIPLGLERSDFHSLHVAQAERGELEEDRLLNNNSGSGGIRSGRQGTDVVTNEDGEMWSAEDDRILVELVLEKLRLSKQEWSDCARSLGKDRGSVGRRWKSLVMSGEIGLKHRGARGRGKIHGTWR